jgi:hypothetical protein
MVRSFGRQNSIQKSKSFNIKRMFEIPGRQIQSLIFENGHEDGGSTDDKVLSKSYDTRYIGSPLDRQYIGSALSRDTAPVSRLDGVGARVGSPLGKPLSGKIK